MNRTGPQELIHRTTSGDEPGTIVDSRCPVLHKRLNTGLFKDLKGLALPADDFVIAGSAPLYIRDLRDEVSDLDVVAGERCWRQAQPLGSLQPAPYGDVLSVGVVERKARPVGPIEVLNAWFPPLFGNVAQLIENAEVVDGLRFLTLQDTYRWKERLGREKDRDDLSRVRRKFPEAPLWWGN